MGLLERAHAYKDKVAKGIAASMGLFAYPVLQAADILIYRSQLVPVGQDQKQHIEMTRDMAGKFNPRSRRGAGPPGAQIGRGAVVPGIDGQKMSKSYDNTIEMFAEPKQAKKAIMSIMTDSHAGRSAQGPRPRTTCSPC